ncbi:Alpha-12-mannosyltransferase MNN24 [Spathaspora sp. JA1]|nr:Alpha-12-mannosyltransferase MNN24 [Spathaspora sp. JA1]
MNISPKTLKSILVGLFTATVLHLFYSYHRNSTASPLSSLSSRSGRFGFLSSLTNGVFISSKNAEEEYKLLGYHKDSQTNLIVLQKSYVDDHLDSTSSQQVWNFLKSDIDHNVDFDLKLINGYNYREMIRHINSENELMLNSSVIEQFETEQKFIHASRDFFEKLVQSIRACKPDIPGINNDEHFPNSRKIEDFYQSAKKLSDEELRKVDTEDLLHKHGHLPVYGGHLREQYSQELVRTKEYLSLFMTLSQQEIGSLRNSHAAFVHDMVSEYPEDLLQYNKFNDFMKGDGIIYLGGGKYNNLVLVSLRILRENNSRLPVEVIVPNEKDFDHEFCHHILPSLNAKCKIMTHYLPKGFMDKVGGYQLKNIALLVSSFERVLYIDADNIPVKNPDVLFVNKPFTNKHLVLWPDLWRRSTSPTFYDIAGISVDENARTRNSYTRGDPRGVNDDMTKLSYHDFKGAIPEASSETGQILINKKVHLKTLVLAMYYNYYGPDFFYPLLSQGAAGEGDKETFIAAAHKLDLPYYQVQEFCREFGPIETKSNKHDIYAMGQFDPVIDYIQSGVDPNLENHASKQTSTKQNIDYHSEMPSKYPTHRKDTTMSNYDFYLYKSSSLAFLHANWPKLYLQAFLDTPEHRGPLDENGDRRRIYGVELVKELDGYDFEMHITKSMYDTFCTKPYLAISKDGVAANRDKVCEQMLEHIKFLKTE